MRRYGSVELAKALVEAFPRGFGLFLEFRAGEEGGELLFEFPGIAGVEPGNPESGEFFGDFPGNVRYGEAEPFEFLPVHGELPEEPFRLAVVRHLARDADSVLLAAALPVAGHHGSVSREDLGRGGDFPGFRIGIGGPGRGIES